MEPITHAVSGALLALALPKRPITKLFIPIAAFMSVFPDLDLLIAFTPIDFLLLHRGITHSIIYVPIFACLLAILAFPLWKKPTKDFEEHTFQQHCYKFGNTEFVPYWTFGETILFAALILLLHIWLDCITTYGTMIFAPFSDYKARLDAVFIIDLLLTLPLICLLYRAFKAGKRSKEADTVRVTGSGSAIISQYTSARTFAAYALLWVFIYPITCVGIRYHLEYTHNERLLAEYADRVKIKELAVLPDAFAPFYWRLIYQNDIPYTNEQANQNATFPQSQAMQGFNFKPSDDTVYHQGITLFSNDYGTLARYPALEDELAESLHKETRQGRAFLDFTLMPIREVAENTEITELITEQADIENDTEANTEQATELIAEQATELIAEQETANITESQEFAIYDLRFSTALPIIHEIMEMRNNGLPPFMLFAKQQVIDNDAHWTELRMNVSSESGQWQEPETPRQNVPWWQKILGIQY